MRLLCVDDSRNEASKHFQQWVVEGEIYTIRRVEGSLYQGQRVLLKEVKNLPVWIPELQTKCEPGFSIQRFKEIDELGNVAENVEEKHLILQ